MNRKVINRKNIILAHSFVDVLNTNPFIKKHIDLSFQPDTMIVKLINALGTQDLQTREDEVYTLFCRNINEHIGSFFDGSTSTPNLTFDVSNATFNTEWIIESQRYNGSLDRTSSAIIIIHLEFLQHEEK